MTTTIVIDKNLRVPAHEVWSAIESVGGLDRWFPIIDACRVEGAGVGALRILTLAGGAGEMRDRIVEIAPAQMRLRYHRIELPFPVSDYFGTVEIFSIAALTSRLVWTVRFEASPADAEATGKLVFDAISDGVDGMERELMAAKA